jgi:uncharacterized protein YndB with AHSA1/START domain
MPKINATSDVDPVDAIVWRLALAAPPDRVFQAWLTPADHQRFWCERSEALPTGGYRLEFIDGTIELCAVEELQAPSQITFRYFHSRVDIRLARRNDKTDLTLVAHDVALHEWNDVHAGWLNVLLPFKAWVDFGIDLRNNDPRRTWSQRYVDQ